MPYQNDPDSVADDLFDAIPKFSQLMPKAFELTDPAAISMLPELKQRFVVIFIIFVIIWV